MGIEPTSEAWGALQLRRDVNKELSRWQYRACRAPGTTRSRHRFIAEEIYFAMCKIRVFAVSRYGFKGELPEVFCEGLACLLHAVWMCDEFPKIGQP